MEGKINDWIAEAVSDADRRADEMADFINRTNALYDVYPGFDPWWAYWEGDTEKESGNYFPPSVVSVRARNGYIWAVVSMQYSRTAQDCETCYYHTVSQIWDMETGKVVELCDLFRENVRIDELLNQVVREASGKPYNAFNCYIEMTADFTGLPETGWCVTPEGIYIDAGSANFVHGVFYPFDFGDGVLASEVFRNMEGCFDTSVLVSNVFAKSSNPIRRTYVNDGLFDVELLDEGFGNAEVRAKINADFLSRVEEITPAYVEQAFKEQGLSGEIDFWFYSWGCTEYTDRFVLFETYGSPGCTVGDTNYGLAGAQRLWLYDLRTGERMEWTGLLTDGWEEACSPWTLSPVDSCFVPAENVDFSAWTPALSSIGFDCAEHPDKPFFVRFLKQDMNGEHMEEQELDVFFPLSSLGFPEEN